MKVLEQDWKEGGILPFMSVVAGQEAGGKKDQLRYVLGGRYEKSRAIMLGDAIGDLKAARDNGILFYPINPGREKESWDRFYREALERFLVGSYAGEYEEELIQEFLKLLPHEKPWRVKEDR